MNIQQSNPNQLFDLLARQWALNTAVEAAVFSFNGGALAFACSDGTMSVVTTNDDDSATRRLRRAVDTTQQTIRPRKRVIAPVQQVKSPEPRSSRIEAFGKSNFVFGTENGNLVQVTPQGVATRLDAGMGVPVVAVAAAPGGTGLCFAAGTKVVICQGKNLSSPVFLELDNPVVGLKYSRDSSALAVADHAGISIWDMASTPRLKKEFPLAYIPQQMRWSPNSQWLTCTVQADGAILINLQNNQITHFSDFPTAVNSLSFNTVVNAIAISGAFRATAWSLAELRTTGDIRKSALRSGRPGMVLVEAVAACPTRNILAVGYANGLLNLTQIGGDEEMVLDQGSGDGISNLSWDRTGKFLAIGRVDGSVALAEFPTGLFK